jgi:hypothetical protein
VEPFFVAFERTNGNIEAASSLAGTSRRNVYYYSDRHREFCVRLEAAMRALFARQDARIRRKTSA